MSERQKNGKVRCGHEHVFDLHTNPKMFVIGHKKELIFVNQCIYTLNICVRSEDVNSKRASCKVQP